MRNSFWNSINKGGKYILCKLRCITLIFFVLSFNVSYSAPTISGITGTVSSGEIIIIEGEGYGTKSTVDPLMYENFDTNDTGRQNTDGIRGEDCSDFGSWEVSGEDALPIYTNLNQRAGSILSSLHPIVCNDTAQNHANSNIIFSADHIPTYVFTIWEYVAWSNVTGTGNVKYFRLNDGVSNEDNHTSLQVLGSTGQAFTNNQVMVTLAGGGTGATWPIEGDSTLNYTISNGSWHQWIFFLKASDNGTANGSATIWLDGQLLENTTVMETFATGDIWKELTLGWYCALYTTGDVNIQYDNIYIDSTWQSVWIGNADTWAGSSVRAIQIPISWSDTSVQVTVNQDAYADEVTAYLYMMDESGDTSPGELIIIGSGSQPTEPGKQTTLDPSKETNLVPGTTNLGD